MTFRIAAANGNLTAGATWQAADATVQLNSESSNTALTTAYVESQPGTPGATTIDAILLKVASRNASPTGTISARVAQGGVTVPGTEVTINVSDLPTGSAVSGGTTPGSTAEIGWVMFKLAAPVTLAAATAYTVSAKTSNASQVNLWRDGTAGNWSRLLRTTTTGAPAAGDDMIIIGEWTGAGAQTARSVTMDSTAATDYGSNTTTQVSPALAIGNGGTLSFGTAGSTNYLLQLSGYAVIYNGGTLNIGSSGAEIPRTSTATLQFDCTNAGDFGLVARNGATVNMYGLSRTAGKNVPWTYLASDVAASGTSANTVADTGWKSGDVIVFAPTNRPSSASATTQAETVSLTADSTTTSIAFGAVTNAHSGTSPIAGEIGNLTRNVVVKQVTSGKQTFCYWGQAATVSLSWAEFAAIGLNSTAKGSCYTATTTGSLTIDSCSIHDTANNGLESTGNAWNNVTLSNTVIYNTTNSGVLVASATSGSNWTLSANMVCKVAANNGFKLADVGGTVSYNSVSGLTNASNDGYLLIETAALGTFVGNVAHSNGGVGFNKSGSAWGTLANCASWRNGFSGGAGAGFVFNGGLGVSNDANGDRTLTLSGCNAFGNALANYYINADTFSPFLFDACSSNGDTTNATTDSVHIVGSTQWDVRFLNCDFSSASGIKTACTNEFNIGGAVSGNILVDDCKTGAATFATGQANLCYNGFLKVQRFNQTAGDHRSYGSFGTIQTEATTVHTPGGLSQRLTPISAVSKLVSQSILVACQSGKAATPVVYVQKDGSYAGAAARLILKRQDSIGVAADTVLASLSAGSGTWQGLTGTTPAATEDGVFEFVVDCDGTAGSVIVDDASATTA